jgi:phosphatidylserine decarboxylase
MTSFLPKIHKEGYLFIAIFVLITLFLFLIWIPLGWLGVLLTVWCCYFFRDPERVPPNLTNLWLAPADGVVCAVNKMSLPEEIRREDQSQYHRVSIFMNVFNCHINRAPFGGKIEFVDYVRGAFFNASWDKASAENERQHLTMRSGNGDRFVVTQIAGLVARRIVCWTTMGRDLQRGERFGMIRFGSRVDIYLPAHIEPIVVVGQTMVGGETIIALNQEKTNSATGEQTTNA